jgi:hypothetical protein
MKRTEYSARTKGDEVITTLVNKYLGKQPLGKSRKKMAGKYEGSSRETSNTEITRHFLFG